MYPDFWENQFDFIGSQKEIRLRIIRGKLFSICQKFIDWSGVQKSDDNLNIDNKEKKTSMSRFVGFSC